MSDAELPAVSSTKTPVARIQHSCCECDVPIQPGQRYERTNGCWDGEWRVYKTCWPCYELRHKYAEAEGGFYEYGGLRETMRNGPLATGGTA